jgi:hypothetical protein
MGIYKYLFVVQMDTLGCDIIKVCMPEKALGLPPC